MKPKFYTHMRDGRREFHELTEGVKLPRGAKMVERLPELGERWERGRFVMDHALKVDLETPPAHVEQARAVKIVEAMAIKSGVALTAGLLAHEADLRGLTLEGMADLVLEKAAAFLDLERERMAAKTGVATA